MIALNWRGHYFTSLSSSWAFSECQGQQLAELYSYFHNKTTLSCFINKRLSAKKIQFFNGKPQFLFLNKMTDVVLIKKPVLFKTTDNRY